MFSANPSISPTGLKPSDVANGVGQGERGRTGGTGSDWRRTRSDWRGMRSDWRGTGSDWRETGSDWGERGRAMGTGSK